MHVTHSNSTATHSNRCMHLVLLINSKISNCCKNSKLSGPLNYLLDITSSFLLSNGKQYSVIINENFSIFEPITAGVLQGSILGTILFDIYVSDISQTPWCACTNIAVLFFALFAENTRILILNPAT